jgi:beta-glucosidase-like glycosyl hydrolase/CubicO group peptidase (beta-lactamase class C family)
MSTRLTYILVFFCAIVFSAQAQERADDPALTYAKDKLSSMSLEEKVGQLFMIRAHSDKGPDHIKSVEEQIKKYKVGGLCFFQGTPTKQAELTNKYQRLSDTPLMVAIDAEWGLGMRHLGDAISFPKQLTLGAIDDNTLIYEMGKTIAGHLKRIGIHVNFAPVVDVNNNPANPVIHNRSFGENTFNVATKSYAYAKGLQDAGVIACMKHFPGHGDTDVDSHYDLPLINHNRSRLDSIEMMPFRVLSQLGIKSVMTAHLAIPALDDSPNRPTSLSRKVVTELLQDKLHFDGLIFTDGLEMHGVAKHFKPGDMEMEAIKAGNDIMLLPIDIGAAVDQIVSAIKSGELGLDVIEQKALKILKSKYELQLTGKPYIKDISRIKYDVNDQRSKTLKKKLYEKALTLVKDDNKQVPIRDLGSIASLSLGSQSLTVFQKTLQEFGITKHLHTKKNISADRKQSILKQLATYDKVIISLHDMSIYASKEFGITKSMFDLIYELNSRQKVILVNNGSPYALNYFSTLPTIIQAYEEDDLMEEVTAQSLLGVNAISGKLPVTAHPQFPVGTSLTRSSLNRLGYARPEEVLIDSEKLLAIDTIVQEMLDKKAAPGCQILAARKGKIFYNKAFGYHTDKRKKKVTVEDMYDVASITKTLATTISLMRLYDQGQLNIHHPLDHYLPELDTTNKGDLIIEDVLAHHSGLPGWIPFYEDSMDKEAKKPTRLKKYYRETRSDSFPLKVTDELYLRKDFRDTIYRQIYNCDLRETRDYRYSDLGFYLFQKIIENSVGLSLDAYTEQEFYKPLGLTKTLFNPLSKYSKDQITPSEDDNYFRNQVVHGHVHDMGAAMLGGVAGHAGLFSNASELAVLMQMLLNGGSYADKRYIAPQTVKKFTHRYGRSTRRGLGFDMKELNPDKTENMCEEASDLTFGHLGFTGISVYADPKYDLIYIFLSNRTYPTMNNRVFSRKNYRPRIQSVFYKAMMDTDLN